MGIYLFFWKCWLKANLLTKEITDDYIAEVSTIGTTLRNKDIAQRLVASRTQYKYEDILNILTQADELKRQAVAEGSSVLDGVCQITPRVLGTWTGGKTVFDPKVHKITVDMVPSADLRKILTQVGVELLGIKDSVAYISNVTDVMSGEVNGTLTPGGNVIIDGSYIKVDKGDGTTNGSIFFMDSEGNAHGVTLPLTVNDPSRVICTVPENLTAGEYTVKINTRYTRGRLLNDFREIVSPHPLTVK